MITFALLKACVLRINICGESMETPSTPRTPEELRVPPPYDTGDFQIVLSPNGSKLHWLKRKTIGFFTKFKSKICSCTTHISYDSRKK